MSISASVISTLSQHWRPVLHLQKPAFDMLKASAVDRLVVATNFFQEELKARTYTKVSMLAVATAWLTGVTCSNIIKH